MGGWFWLLALGLFGVLIGLYLHWSIVLLGALLPFLPVVAELRRRRRQRQAGAYAFNQSDYPDAAALAKLATLPAARRDHKGPMQTTGQMVLANRLADGRSVFLTRAGTWVEDIAGGALATDPAEAERLLAAGREAEAVNTVVEPYLIAIGELDGQRRPVSYREAIRADGPTVRTDR